MNMFDPDFPLQIRQEPDNTTDFLMVVHEYGKEDVEVRIPYSLNILPALNSLRHTIQNLTARK